jgi:hypothetical protein
VESIQRVVIRAEMLRCGLPSNCLIQLSAQRGPIHDTPVDTKPNDAPRDLIHHDENPISSQHPRFTTEQIAAPQTVPHVAEKSKPGRLSRTRFRLVMNAQDTANHILVDLDAERQRDLLGDSGAAPAGISPFHFNDHVDEFLTRSLRARLTPALRRKQYMVLTTRHHVLEMQQSGRLQKDGGTEETRRAREEGAQTGDDPIGGAQVRSTLAGAIEDQ